jgi:hypothetical protein
MDYDYETIEAKMKSLPDDLQEAMTSFDTANKVEEIGKKYSLHIDQIGALGDVTSYVMLGLVPGRNFVSVLMKKAEMDEKTASLIAKDVNTEIFDGIRESLRIIEAKEMTNNSDLEKAGGISVDKNQASADIVSGGKASPQMSAQISKAVTLDAIENPPAFIDHLLTGPSTSINETVVKAGPAAPTVPTPGPTVTPTPPKPAPAAPTGPRIDPYREPIE